MTADEVADLFVDGLLVCSGFRRRRLELGGRVGVVFHASNTITAAAR